MSLQVYCVVDKCHWSNEPTQFFVVSPSLEDALTAFRHNFAAPHSKYNLAATPAEVETSLQLELSSRTGQWDKVGYLKLRVNRDIPKTLPVFVTSLQPNMVFN